tara:strand:+ start:834 stop:1253 length:420 start_codon:yes stop_codon:yes gene_type:complete
METIPLKNDVFEPNVTQWGSYDTSEFPKVKVKLTGKIESQESFNHFIEEWRNLYKMNKRFTLHFDATDVGMVSMKYAFQMRRFVRELKSDHPKLLEKSFIKTDSKWVRFLLGMIFLFEKPVAPVYVTNVCDNGVKTYYP